MSVGFTTSRLKPEAISQLQVVKRSNGTKKKKKKSNFHHENTESVKESKRLSY